jgi:hypothetical protein
MEAVNTSDTLVNFYQTARPNMTEDSQLHTRHGENPKSHWSKMASESACFWTLGKQNKDKER